MKIAITIYIIMFVLVVGTFVSSYILLNVFPNSKLTNFWRKHIATDEDLDNLY